MNDNLGQWKEFCVDFVLPFALLCMLFVLLLTGIDGEVKTLMAGAAGWLFKSGITRKKAK